MSSKGVVVKDTKKFNGPINTELSKRKLKLMRTSNCLYLLKGGCVYSKEQSISRINKRCHYTGRKKGLIGIAKMTRMHFKKESFRGYIPGVRKSSW